MLYPIIASIALLVFVCFISLLTTEYLNKGWKGRGMVVFVVGLYAMVFFVVQSFAWYEKMQKEQKTYVPPKYEPVQEQLYRLK